MLVYYRKEYDVYAPFHPYDVYGSITPGVQSRLLQTTAEKFLFHKSGGAFVVSFQRRAWGAIFPQLRLVSMQHKGFCFELYFYVDGELSESDKKSVEEIRSSFGEDLYHRVVKATSAEIIRIDSPKPIHNYPGVCLFARKENPPLVSIKNVVLDADIDFYHKVLLAMQWAMINHIFPRIRAVQLDIEAHSVIIRVVVSEISEEEQKSLEEMKLSFVEQLPELQSCILRILQKPFSKEPLDRIDWFPETVYYSKGSRLTS
jgi:hypothetical protein